MTANQAIINNIHQEYDLKSVCLQAFNAQIAHEKHSCNLCISEEVCPEEIILKNTAIELREMAMKMLGVVG